MSGWPRRGGWHEGRVHAGALSPQATQRQMDVLAAYVAAGGSVAGAAGLVRIRPSTVKRHLADLRARSGLTTEQLIYRGRAEGWLVVPDLEPQWPPGLLALVEPVGPGGRGLREEPSPVQTTQPDATRGRAPALPRARDRLGARTSRPSPAGT
jgi:hypothetical protein